MLRDNVWGPQIEDAARRDFTVNAMYYDPQREIVVDYHGGIKDAKKKLLRMIGDPATRYREDPVRIIRVVRFAAKLGFEIEPKTRAPIKEMAALLDNVPASRTFDEMIKLLQTGHALASIEELRKQGLHRGVFPVLDVALDEAHRHDGREKFVQLALADTDRRVGEGKPVAPSFMLACMLWHDVLDRWNKLRAGGEPAVPGAAAGHRRGVRRAHRRHLRPRQAGRRHARDLDDAAALRAARRQRGVPRWSSSRAFAPASTSCACAPMPARSTANWPSGGKTFRWAATKNVSRLMDVARERDHAARVAPARRPAAGRCTGEGSGERAPDSRRRRPGAQEAPAPAQARGRRRRR